MPSFRLPYNPSHPIPYFLLFSFLAGFILFGSGATVLSSLACVVFMFLGLQFIAAMGNTIPMSGFILVIASLQWLIGPVLSYAGYSRHYKYYMYVPQEEYFPFAISSVLAFTLGMFLFNNKKDRQLHMSILPALRNHLAKDPNISLKLIAVGWVSSLLLPFVSGTLGFIFFLLSNVLYIGLLYMLFQRTTLKWWVLAGVFFLLFLTSLQSTMFHNLLLWLAFASFYIVLVKKFSFTRKFLLVLLGVGMVYVFQIVKWEIRSGAYAGNLSSFFSIVNDKVLNTDPDEFEEESPMEGFVNRINQGWIISRIMEHIPAEEPYVEGETIKAAIEATLIPRFLNPEKSTVGGKEYFLRFTGFGLTASTSMGASLLGEGYANYGKLGAIIFLFCVGLFFRLVLNILYALTGKYPTLILWLPLIFLQVVKAESDLLRVLNHLIKTGILVFLIYFIFGKVLKWKI